MAKCPKCSTRKGKRRCPALGQDICAACCAENRLVTIPCPRDCSYLQGELYQRERRMARALSEGKVFLKRQERLFARAEAREFAFRLQADIYYFARENGPVDDAAAAECLEVLESSLSPVFVPTASTPPLARFLLERLRDRKRYEIAPSFGTAERRQVLAALTAHVRALAQASRGARAFHDELSSFFDQLDFEADLDYSPQDGTEPAEEKPARQSPGGLILPRSS